MTNAKEQRTLTHRLVAGALSLTSMLALISLVLMAGGPAAQAQPQLKTQHAFTGGGDGANPKAGVTLKNGNVYGTASAGGNGSGTAWQATPNANGYTTLPISVLSSGGAVPLSRLVFGPDGHPYGTTYQGGTRGGGVAFDLLPPLTICRTVSCYWKENVLVNFGTDIYRGGYGDLLWDASGNIYGTAVYGGSGYGGVYELTKTNNTWTETLLYPFKVGTDGRNPQSGLIADSNGNLFGTTLQGGTGGYGTVFELSYLMGIGWNETLIYNFQNGPDGKYPEGGLVMDQMGNLYGTTSDGGSGGGGTVFELSPLNGQYSYAPVYSFTGTLNRQCGPWASLTLDASGSLYGTTFCDGANKLGSVFKLTKTQNTWNLTSLHDFTGMTDGSNPISNVTVDASGNMYGTTSMGGDQKAGTWWTIPAQQ